MTVLVPCLVQLQLVPLVNPATAGPLIDAYITVKV